MQIDNKNNNFGFLRLFFAILVIFSHAPEALDGNRNQELMVRMFGGMSMGDLAVECFFMISGYLILMSYQHSASFSTYLRKRILRICPGFFAAFLFSVLIVVPLAQNMAMLLSLDTWFWIKAIARMLTLNTPWVDGVFNTPIPYLNGPMWTIRYEFLCYLLLPLISFFFKYNWKHYIVLLLAIISLQEITNYVAISIVLPKPFDIESGSFLRLFSSYIMGNIIYLARNVVPFEKKYALLSAILLIALLFVKPLEHIALITIGAYLLFYVALHYQNRWLSRVGSKVDISYGIYLYAWPIQNLIIHYKPRIHQLSLSLLVLAIVTPIALISWFVVEKPFIRLKTKKGAHA